MNKENKLNLYLVGLSLSIVVVSIAFVSIFIENTSNHMKEQIKSSIMQELSSANMPEFNTNEPTYKNLHETFGVIPNYTERVESSVEEDTEIEESEDSNPLHCKWGGFTLTNEEYELVCKTVMREVGSSKEPFEAKVMVATVIINQLLDEEFPDTIRKVIYYKNGNNFTVVLGKNFEDTIWTNEVGEAVRAALKENKYPRDMLYFRTGHYHTWAKDYKKVGNTYFSTRK